MKTCVLLLLVLGCVYGAPVDHGLEAGSCDDPAAVSASHLALSKINLDRTEGYVFSLHRLSNVHLAKHEEAGVVYYLTLDVEETNCSVVSRKDWKDCEARTTTQMPVYGQCKAAIFISKPHRVVRLYKYRCLIRPAPAARVTQLCPDCPTFIGFDNEEVNETVTLSLEKFNKESNYHNRFALRHISRATAGMAMSMAYHVEYTIQETTCGKNTEESAANPCPLMTCGFAHLGFCKASHYHVPGGDPITTVNCEIYEPEASEREKALHLLGDATGHSHNDTHTHGPGDKHTHGNDHGNDHGKKHGNDHGNDRGHGNDHGNDRGHGNDHGNDRGHGNDHGNDRGHGNDHGNDHGKKHGNDHGNDRGHGNDHGNDRGHGNDHGNDRGHGNDHGNDRGHGNDHGNDHCGRHGNDHGNDRGHGNDHGNDHGKKPGNDHGNDHGNDRGHGNDHGNDRGHGNDHGNDRGHGNDHGNDRGHGNDHGNDHGKKPGNDHGNDHGNDRGHGNDHGNDHGKKRNKTCSFGHSHGHRFGHRRPGPHDHIHDHTKDHSHHHGEYPEGSNHHHKHDHKPGSAYRHAHDHSHDHGIDGTHDHVHAYHAQASNHKGDFPNQHHNYTHPEGTHTHEHDHEIALDHDHRHAHLHEHEHHHHHHTHDHEKEHHDEPEGMVKMIGALGQPITSPIFPEVPPQPAILMLKPDPEIPGVSEPGILGFQNFPDTASADCAPPAPGQSLVSKLFAEDDVFKPGNHF